MAVTRLAGGVEDWKMSGDGSRVYYVVSNETQVDDGWKALREEHDDVEYLSLIHISEPTRPY